MSNRLISEVQRLRQLVPVGARGVQLPARDMFPSEMAVLMALANDARDHLGGVSTLPTVKIMARTRLSEPAVRKAYRQLQANGHITRIRGAEGEQAVTKVHPKLTPFTTTAADTWVSSVQVTPISNTGHPCIEDMGLIEDKNLTNNHSPRAHAHEVSIEGFRVPPEGEPVPTPAPPPPPAPAKRELAPVDQVIAAWNAMAARCGLPSPVTLDVEREVTIEALLRREKLFRLLATVEHVGRSPFLTGKRASGQGDWMASFDWVFEVRRWKASGNFRRVVEGEFNRGQPVPPEPSEPAPDATAPASAMIASGEPAAVQRLRAGIRARIGPADTARWIDPLRLEISGAGVLAIAPSAFHADWVTQHHADQLRGAAGGVPVRVVCAARVLA